MKTTVIILSCLAIAIATGFVLLNRKGPIHREWTSAVTFAEALTNEPFVAKVDAVRFGYQTPSVEAPFEYVVIFLSASNGNKSALIENKPRARTIAWAKKLRPGQYYPFPDVLLQAATNGLPFNK